MAHMAAAGLLGPDLVFVFLMHFPFCLSLADSTFVCSGNRLLQLRTRARASEGGGGGGRMEVRCIEQEGKGP